MSSVTSTATAMTPAARQEMLTAIHESAHAVIATVYGATVEKSVLTPDDPERAGLTTYRQHVTGQRRADIVYAGVYGEAFARHGGPPTPRGLRLVMAHHHHDATALRAAGDPSGQVPRLVANCWPSITGLARELYASRRISQTDIDKALFLPADADEPTRNHALSLIRSGSVPGSFTVHPVGTR